jgi:PQQ-dependent dehydrogenase (methanol/ethanol family)
MSISRPGVLAVSVFLLLGTGAVHAQLANGFVPVTDDILENPDPDDWLMWRRTLDGWGFSPQAQIDKGNVASLQLVWSQPLNAGTVQEGTPLVYDGIMYMPHPGDMVQALDAATGAVIWEYRRERPEDLLDYLAFSDTNRALAIYGENIVFTTNDDYIVGLDVHTGAVNWETQIFDFHTHPVQQSSGPIMIRGKAISGRTCQPPAGPDACVITAHDPDTGEELWRLNTIERPGEGDSWGDLPWEARWHVGAWMMPSYDPELDLIYMGTSVTAPAPKYLLAGNDKTYLYHNSTLAIDPDDGHIVWYYQHLVDHWDLDHPFERLLVDTKVAPDPEQVTWINPAIDPDREYKVLTGIPGKTGVVYTLDRETGEFLWARPTVKQTVVGDIDGATGKVTVNPDMLFQQSGDVREVCPSPQGGKNWQAGAYSPLTNMMYYSLQNSCAEVTAILDEPDPETSYGISGREKIAPDAVSLGSVHAISAETGRTAWTFNMPGTALSLLATGGGLVIGGDIEGNVRAFDQENGAVLWEVNLGSSVTGYPVTYAVDGKQYLAVSTGPSVTTNSQRRILPDLKVNNESRLYVFALP